MNIHNINTIARYEVKLLKRSWLFRIFAILTLLGVTGTLLLQYSTIVGFVQIWKNVGVSSMFPFASTYYYCIAQSIIVIFLAGNFLKRDKKMDTAEVIYVRPMSNADYIIGKTWGIMKVFISLNIVILIITAFINIFITKSPFSVFPYVFYLFTISIPSLLFVLGLSFTAMCLLKNQAVTFIVMLGIIGVVFFYLTDYLYGTFDFFGVNIPGIFSEVTGLADIRLFLLQRLAYLLLGIGFITFTVSLVKRLPHRPWKVIVVDTFGSFFILAGCICGLLYVLHYNHADNLRNDYIATYNNFVDTEKVYVTSNEITIEPAGRKLNAESALKVKNNNPEAINKIILYLNPSLTVSSIESNGKSLAFTRDNQVIIIDKNLNPGEEIPLSIKYSGKIDENICNVDVPEDEIKNTKIPSILYRLGKRYAYLEDKFTLLTPESIWYPVGAAPSNPAAPYQLNKNFTDYKLTVRNQQGKTVLSQGEANTSGQDIIFTNPTPLLGISLTIADYEKKSLTVDSVNYELYYFKGHDFFSQYFPTLQDTLPALIRNLKNGLELGGGRSYPFRKFAVAETPVHFSGYLRNWKGNTEYVMPEILLLPERGVTASIDFMSRNRGFRGGVGRRQGDIDPKEIETNLFYSFFYQTLTAETVQQGFQWNDQAINMFNINPMLSSLTNFVYSQEYPVFDIAINTMQNNSGLGRVFVMGGSMSIDDRQRANFYLKDHSFKVATEDIDLKPKIAYELIKLKSYALKNYITSTIPVDRLNRFMSNFSNKYRFQEVSFDKFSLELKEEFGVDLTNFMQDWYNQDQTPAIYIRDVDANQILVDDFTKYQIRFRVNNPSEVDAIISANIIPGESDERGGRGRGMRGRRMSTPDFNSYNNNYIIPAKTAKEIKIIIDERPANITIETNISQNLPTSFVTNFAKINNTISDTLRGVFDANISTFAANPNEFIIDNEDPGFKIIESNNKQKLKDLFKKESEEKYNNFIPWNFPTKWTMMAADFCYGDIVKSGFYKAKGSGANAVEWHTEIPKDGYYDVAIWNPKSSGGGGGMVFVVEGRRGGRHQRENRTQSYTIKYDQKQETISLDLEQEKEGWVSLGNFYLPQGEVVILLSDKVTGNYVIADAVKFTKTEE